MSAAIHRQSRRVSFSSFSWFLLFLGICGYLCSFRLLDSLQSQRYRLHIGPRDAHVVAVGVLHETEEIIQVQCFLIGFLAWLSVEGCGVVAFTVLGNTAFPLQTAGFVKVEV